MKSRLVKIAVSVPIEFSDNIREAMGKSIGSLGNYEYTSFTLRGVGRFRPLVGANPTIGEIGEIEKVEEDKIETIAERKKLDEIISAIREAHPYEFPIIDVIALEDIYTKF